MDRTEVDNQLKAFSSLVSRARSVASRAAWAAAMQSRTTRVAAILRRLRHALVGQTITRTKDSGVWNVSVDGHLVLVINTRTSARVIDELAAAIPIRIVRADLVRYAELERIARDHHLELGVA